MKNYILIFVLILFVNLNAVYAQTTVQLSIANQTVTGTDFFFEIQMRATSGTLYLASADLVLTFNSGNFTAPACTRDAVGFWILDNSNADNTTSLVGTVGAYYRSKTSPAAISSNEIILNVAFPDFVDQGEFDQNVAKITAVPVAFGKYKISGISNSSGTMGLAWKTGGGGVVTNILTYANTTPWATTPVTIDASPVIPNTPLPVELSLFSAAVTGNFVDLQWVTKTEVNNYGFEIQKLQNYKIAKLQDWETAGFIKGSGNSNSPKEYSFSDKKVKQGKYSYRLKQIDNDGAFEYSEVVEVEVNSIPEEFYLLQNYPNPFNPTTTIEYGLAEDALVQIDLFNCIGEKVKTIINQNQNAGVQNLNINAGELASGYYILNIRFSNNNSSINKTIKMCILK